jgi:hypothetical protein
VEEEEEEEEEDEEEEAMKQREEEEDLCICLPAALLASRVESNGIISRERKIHVVLKGQITAGCSTENKYIFSLIYNQQVSALLYVLGADILTRAQSPFS